MNAAAGCRELLSIPDHNRCTAIHQREGGEGVYTKYHSESLKTPQSFPGSLYSGAGGRMVMPPSDNTRQSEISSC